MAAVIGVYRDRSEVQGVTRDLIQHGVDNRDISIGATADHDLSISAEMDAEVSEGWGSAGLGTFLTAEMMRGALVFIAIGAAIGLVLGVPIGLLLYHPAHSTWTQVWVGAMVGVLFGGVVGGLLGGGFAMQSPEEHLAAERGHTVSVAEPPQRSRRSWQTTIRFASTSSQVSNACALPRPKAQTASPKPSPSSARTPPTPDDRANPSLDELSVRRRQTRNRSLSALG